MASARTPRAAQSSTTPRTASRGTVRTARSTGPGRSRTDGYARTPATSAAFGLTGKTGPRNPFRSRASRTRWPIPAGSREAPTTATAFGRKNGTSEATVATRSRVSTRATLASVGATARSTSTSPPSARSATG